MRVVLTLPSVLVFGAACNAVLGDLRDRSVEGGVDAGHDVGVGDTTVPGDARTHDAKQTDSGLTDRDLSDTGSVCTGTKAPGLTTCPGGTGTESCCASLEVSSGTFHRAYNAEDSGLGVDDGGPADAGGTGAGHPASVTGFRLDKYLVTVARFRKFVSSGAKDPAPGTGKHASLHGGSGLANSAAAGGYESGWKSSWSSNGYVSPTDANLKCAGTDAGYHNTWTSAPGDQEDLPIGCVNWYEAYAFCIWDGGYLPTEAEWEYAAAGGSEQRDFPWGSTWPGTNNVFAIYDEYYNGNPTQIAPVGSAPDGAARWGQLDMAGELYEWTLDSWSGSFADPCQDCAYLDESSGERVQKTQRFGSGPSIDFLVPPYRTATDPIGRNYTSGFRCARDR